VWALESFSPPAVVALRFGIAALVAIPLAAHRHGLIFWRSWREGVVPGVFLSLSVLFQTWGLQTTSATKSGFILGLYIFMVPIWEALFERRLISLKHWVCVLTAVAGSYLILGNPFGSAWSMGDTLTIVATVFASWQIFWLSYRAKSRGQHMASDIFNGWMMFWSAVPALLALPLMGAPTTSTLTTLAIGGIAAVALGSTLVAFHLQVAAQAHLSGSVSSLLCLLESPFGAVFAAVLLHERLELLQWVGCGIILLAAIESLRQVKSSPVVAGSP
jgi:drug/metabolite transporter (DMT)-like permease